MRIGQSRGVTSAREMRKNDYSSTGNGFYRNNGETFHAGYRENDLLPQRTGYRDTYPRRSVICYPPMTVKKRDYSSVGHKCETEGYSQENIAKAMMTEVPERGGIYLVNFGDDKTCCLTAGVRPAVCISGNSYNEGSPILRVVPMTRKFKCIDARYHVFVDRNKCNGLRESGMALGEQCRPIDRTMIEKKIGVIADEGLLEEIVKAAEAIVEFYN